jgi:putative lipoic acid-binding regulatory protein
MAKPTLIDFPCDFPLKIMGAHVDDFAQTIASVVIKHAPEFDAATMTLRPSRAGNYLALTCTVRATSQAQLDALYLELSAHSMVKVVL